MWSLWTFHLSLPFPIQVNLLGNWTLSSRSSFSSLQLHFEANQLFPTNFPNSGTFRFSKWATSYLFLSFLDILLLFLTSWIKMRTSASLRGQKRHRISFFAVLKDQWFLNWNYKFRFLQVFHQDVPRWNVFKFDQFKFLCCIICIWSFIPLRFLAQS